MTQYTNIHSPFHVVEGFISPANCEKIIADLGIAVPSMDGMKPLKQVRIIDDPHLLNLIEDSFFENVGDIQARYRGLSHGVVAPTFNQYFENPKDPCEVHGCESSKYLRKKWVKTKDVDLVAYIWLKDFNNGVPLDPRFETYGGKLEFPAYDFSLVPQRGTMVMFPAGPHFITAISPVLVGTYEHIKFSVKLTQADDGLWLYQPDQFPGTYQEWFTE